MPRGPVILRRTVVPITGLPASPAGLRIAHVSDFHFFDGWNRTFEAAQDLLLGVEYDLLVATGDFVDDPAKWKTAAESARRFFEPLAIRTPIFGSLGNHDDPRVATEADLPVTFLCNRAVTLKLRGHPITIAGVRQSCSGGEDLSAALAKAPPDGPLILLAHLPSTVYRLPSQDVDLVLSGHTHGGQIRFPWIGCVWSNDRLPPSMARGLHRVGSTHLHVNPGIGVSGPIRARFNCPPEVSLLSLQPANIEREAATSFGDTVREQTLATGV